MIICPWCGQQSANDSVCDWCKRPIDRRIGPPPGARNDLDFLKDESEVDRFGMMKIGAAVFCAVAIGALLYFLFMRPSNDTVAQATGGPEQAEGRPQVSATNVPARLVAQPQYQSHPASYWVQQWNNGSDLISNAYQAGSTNWTKEQPATHAAASMPVNVPMNSPVRLQNVEVTLVSLPGGDKRVAGRADIYNGSDKNVIDYRVELVWGASDYTLMPLQGSDASLHQVYQKALRPGKHQVVQLVSLKIKNHPDGTPNSVRLTAWLDGNPGNAIDDYQLQFGH